MAFWESLGDGDGYSAVSLVGDGYEKLRHVCVLECFAQIVANVDVRTTVVAVERLDDAHIEGLLGKQVRDGFERRLP